MWKNKTKEIKENALSRPDSQIKFASRRDRLRKYFMPLMDEYVFQALSDAYLKKAKVKESFYGVYLPFRKEDEGKDTKLAVVLENISRVLGIDPKIKFSNQYIDFLTNVLGKKPAENITKQAKNLASDKDFTNACLLYRAALLLNPFYLDAMYGYARVCREIYLLGGEEEKVGNFKAEALEYFEMLTEIHPNYNYGFYYLGYMYLNLGLYSKTEIMFREFLRLSTSPKTPGKDKREIKERLAQIKEPLEIEQGYNAIVRGSYDEGIDILEPFLESRFKTWWPLFYYLGIGYMEVGREDEAISFFKNVLKQNASHIESMEELVNLYAKKGDSENEKKYKNKIELVKTGNE
jgi:tetratricopeptide (TPR) repeat protein